MTNIKFNPKERVHLFILDLPNRWGFKRHIGNFYIITFAYSMFAELITGVLTWEDVAVLHKATELVPATQAYIQAFGYWYIIPHLIPVMAFWIGILISYLIFKWTTGWKEYIRNLFNNLSMCMATVLFTLDLINDILNHLFIIGVLH